MDNRFFPHATDGSLNVRPSYTFPSTFNFTPNTPIALDARSIISEWSNEALITMDKDEVYVGQQIYCLADKNYRICRWIPGIGEYTAKNCIWDSLHTDKDTENTWVDIKNYVPAKTIEEVIAEENKKTWRFGIDGTMTYWGFYKFDGADTPQEVKQQLDNTDILNDILKLFVYGATDDDVFASYEDIDTMS